MPQLVRTVPSTSVENCTHCNRMDCPNNRAFPTEFTNTHICGDFYKADDKEVDKMDETLFEGKVIPLDSCNGECESCEFGIEMPLSLGTKCASLRGKIHKNGDSLRSSVKNFIALNTDDLNTKEVISAKLHELVDEYIANTYDLIRQDLSYITEKYVDPYFKKG